jgi:hypothetical protein
MTCGAPGVRHSKPPALGSGMPDDSGMDEPGDCADEIEGFRPDEHPEKRVRRAYELGALEGYKAGLRDSVTRWRLSSRGRRWCHLV